MRNDQTKPKYDGAWLYLGDEAHVEQRYGGLNLSSFSEAKPYHALSQSQSPGKTPARSRWIGRTSRNSMAQATIMMMGREYSPNDGNSLNHLKKGKQGDRKIIASNYDEKNTASS